MATRPPETRSSESRGRKLAAGLPAATYDEYSLNASASAEPARPSRADLGVRRMVAPVTTEVAELEGAASGLRVGPALSRTRFSSNSIGPVDPGRRPAGRGAGGCGRLAGFRVLANLLVGG